LKFALIFLDRHWFTEKILQGERFAAYIVIPMYPEGEPDSAAVQPILHMQVRERPNG
jgi:hypothetical protein